MPAAAAGWRLPPCELVVSLSHCVAKAVVPPADVPHLCYCFTPMRYAWHLQHAYLGQARVGALGGWLAEQLLGCLRTWDRRTAQGVTQFVAISRTVQARIAECYGRASEVVYPPVDTDFFCPGPVRRENYFLAVSAFAPYKRLDLAVEACNRLGRTLVVIGSGQDEARLRSLAGPDTHFLGWQPDHVLRDHLRRCQALLFPGEEDFGIVPVEALACGAPVIGYGRGGVTETVVPPGGRKDPTGIWFDEQTVECLIEALEEFERLRPCFSPAAARRQALRFHPRRFQDEFFGLVQSITAGGDASAVRRAA
jgi:glycosyltransferase involved in cell wall biosynthesis